MTHTKTEDFNAGDPEATTYADLVRNLTPRQRAFVEAFAGNAADAARQAGYKGDPHVLSVTAQRLLSNSSIRRAIEERGHEVSQRRIAKREELQELWTDMTLDESLDVADRLRASELLGKSQIMFTEKVLHEGKQTVIIADPYAEPKRADSLMAPNSARSSEEGEPK